MTALLAFVTVLAQNSQEAPDEGIGIGLILLGALIAVLVAVAIFTIFTRGSRKRRGGGPERRPQPPGSVGH